jgi:hypothetical protein
LASERRRFGIHFDVGLALVGRPPPLRKLWPVDERRPYTYVNRLPLNRRWSVLTATRFDAPQSFTALTSTVFTGAVRVFPRVGKQQFQFWIRALGFWRDDEQAKNVIR